jgi:hypothetical protein
MASTISAANLKVKITEEVILNGRDQGGTTELTIASIKDVSKRIVTIAADDDATVLVFKSTTASADGALDKDTVKYIRITNLDDSNSVNISLQLDSDEDNSAADLSVTHLLEAGRSFMMGTPDEAVHADDDAATIVTALTDLESIIVDPGSNAGTVEVFTAST